MVSLWHLAQRWGDLKGRGANYLKWSVTEIKNHPRLPAITLNNAGQSICWSDAVLSELRTPETAWRRFIETAALTSSCTLIGCDLFVMHPGKMALLVRHRCYYYCYESPRWGLVRSDQQPEKVHHPPGLPCATPASPERGPSSPSGESGSAVSHLSCLALWSQWLHSWAGPGLESTFHPLRRRGGEKGGMTNGWHQNRCIAG